MKLNNLIAYLEAGLTMDPIPKLYMTYICGSGCWTIIGLIYGLILKNFWLYIALLMIGMLFVAMTIVSILSSGELSIKRRLIIQTIIYISWFIQIALLELIVFTMNYGWHYFLILLYLPNLLIPILVGAKTSKMLRKDEIFIKSKITRSTIYSSGAMLGLIGMNFAAIFKNISQNTVIIVLLICMLILSSIFSMGLLYIQSLYYIFKYEKLGILPKDFLYKT